MPVVLPPRQSTFELLWARVIRPKYVLVQTDARTPLNLFARMLIPIPVEQIRIPRLAVLADIAPATREA